MQIQEHNIRSDSDRTALDRHAVVAAGQLLMSAIYLEHRVRSLTTRLSVLPNQLNALGWPQSPQTPQTRNAEGGFQ